MTEIISSGVSQNVILNPGNVLMLRSRTYVKISKYLGNINNPPGGYQTLAEIKDRFYVYTNASLVSETILIQPLGYSPCYYNITASGSGYLEDGWGVTYQPNITTRTDSFAAPLTADEVLSRIINVSNSSGTNQNLVMPSKAALDATNQFSNGLSIDFTLTNVSFGGGASTVTLTTNTPGATVVFGGGLVQPNPTFTSTDSSAMFRLTRFNDTQYNCNRIS